MRNAIPIFFTLALLFLGTTLHAQSNIKPVTLTSVYGAMLETCTRQMEARPTMDDYFTTEVVAHDSARMVVDSLFRVLTATDGLMRELPTDRGLVCDFADDVERALLPDAVVPGVFCSLDSALGMFEPVFTLRFSNYQRENLRGALFVQRQADEYVFAFEFRERGGETSVVRMIVNQYDWLRFETIRFWFDEFGERESRTITDASVWYDDPSTVERVLYDMIVP